MNANGRPRSSSSQKSISGAAGPYAGAGRAQQLRAIDAHMGAGAHRLLEAGRDVDHELDLAGVQEVLGERGEDAARGGDIPQLGIGRVGDRQPRRRTPDPIHRCAGGNPTEVGAVDADARADVVDQLERRVIEFAAHDRAFAALGRPHQRDLARAGEALAQPAADAQTGLHDLVERQRLAARAATVDSVVLGLHGLRLYEFVLTRPLSN